MFAMATRQYIKGCWREEGDQRPAPAKPLLSFSQENTFKMLPATAGLEGNAEVTLEAGRGLSHTYIPAPHTNAYTYHTGRHMHLGDPLSSWKMLVDLMRGNFGAQS